MAKLDDFTFWLSVSIFTLLSFLFGFMIGDSKEIIAASSETVFKNYLLGCEIAILGSLYFVIKFYNQNKQ